MKVAFVSGLMAQRVPFIVAELGRDADTGGQVVYVLRLSEHLARLGYAVDIFTRATRSALEPVVLHSDGVTVRHIHAGPFEGLTKDELPGQLCTFALGAYLAEFVREMVGTEGEPHPDFPMPFFLLGVEDPAPRIRALGLQPGDRVRFVPAAR